jgi:GNAT superfamily N-acetyltransferase
MNNYSVYKVLEKDDIDKIAEFYSKFSVEEKNDLQFDFKKELLFKLVNQENKIIGIASVTNDLYGYQNLKRFITPEMRGKKLAGFLLDEIITIAKSEKKLRLNGYYKLENEKAKKHLSEKGFKITDFAVKIDGITFSSALLKLK